MHDAAPATLFILSVLCASVAGQERREAPPPRQDTHDPLQGIDRNGRIPKVALPADLPNPERWRYIPEGRLHGGNVFERFLISSFVVPLVFFESDIGFGGGLSITDIDFRNQRRQEFAGIFLSYTTEGQQRYSIVWQRWLHHRDLPQGGIVQEERSRVRVQTGYERTLTRRFYGLGPKTRENAETSYTDDTWGASVSIADAVAEPGDEWVYNAGVGFSRHSLSRGRVSDVPSTDSVFPALFAAGDRHDSLNVWGGIRYDTRDSQHTPYRGFAVGANATAMPLQTGGDAGVVLHGFVTGVVPIPPLLHDGGDTEEEHPPTDVLAGHFFVRDTFGDLPFWALPSLGGSHTLRGYIENRFTDEAAWHAGIEYRLWAVPRGVRLSNSIYIERLGLALFAEAGTVAGSLGDLFDAEVHASYGISLRASLERLAVFRADFGFSDEGFNLTINYGLSF